MTSSTTLQTVIPGNVTDDGKWADSYKTQFTYNIDGRQFFYGQNLSSKRWFINELLPEGKMGAAETDNGHWERVYEVQFPFVINGRQYFYGQNLSSDLRWFIQELLPGGKMSRDGETDHGFWENAYQVQFPFAIGGHQYFYGHNLSVHLRWFINELLPGGKMGAAETDYGILEHPYEVHFPFVINGRQYYYAQNLSSPLRWFIQEILPGGKMSATASDNGFWKNPYSVQFAYPKLIHGHLYFHRLNFEKCQWFVQELVLDTNGNCKMGDEVANGNWKYPCEIQLPYVLGDVAYFYGNNTGGSHNWFIQELISLDQYTIKKLPSVGWSLGETDNTTLVQAIPKEAPTYAVGWVPYLADWKNYIKNYGLLSGLRYHDPSEIPGVGVLVGATKDALYGDQMNTEQCESLIPYKPDEGHYSWALVPGGNIMYVWNSKLSLDERNYVRHSDLNEGMPVVCAGEFVFSTFPTRLDGLYIELNDSSGHYKPDGKKCFSFVLDAFKELGIDVSQVKVYARKA